MSFEEIKNSIEQDLMNNGFHKDGEDLIRIDRRQHQIVINGQPSIREEEMTIKFSCLGEGSIDDVPTAGFAMYIDNHNVTDVWCTCLEDFRYLTQKI